MSDYLPEDLLEKIFIRVPIMPLLRFTTVCKRWYNLISNPQFTHAHLNFTKLLNDNSSRMLIVYSKMEVDIQNGKSNLKRNYVVCSDGRGGNLEKYASFEFPGDGFVDNLHIIGCCNGLVCLPVICCNSLTADPEQVVMLWNPLIRRFLHLPKFRRSYYTFGFVFDRIKNNYKVIRIDSGSRDKAVMIEIFRLSNGLWEVATREPPFAQISRRSAQVDLEGIAHWVGKDGHGKMKIVTFDPHEEVFGSIGLPVKEGKYNHACNHDWETYLFVFDKSLFLVELVDTTEVVYGPYDDDDPDNHLYDPFDDDDDYMRFKKNKFCIWRMEEYGVVESWTKLHYCAFDISVHPLGFRMNGEILWAGRYGELISTNLEDGFQKYLSTCGTATCFSSCSYYVESLVLLDQTKSNSVQVSRTEESPEKKMVLSDDEFVNCSPSYYD